MRTKELLKSSIAGLVLIASIFAVLILVLWLAKLDVGASLAAIGKNAFGSPFAFSRTLVRATPLIFCGVALCLAWKAGMFNIGAEGQYVAGGLFAAAVYKFLPQAPEFILQILILVAGCFGGALAAGLAAWLQIKRGVQVVISTILLNFILLGMLGWAVNGPLKEASKQRPMTDRIPESLLLWRPFDGLEVNLGVFLALAFAAGSWLYLARSKGGFHLRLVGENQKAARASLVSVENVQLKAMASSGALAGLAGAVTYLGISRQVGEGFAEGFGFLAIPVALLGGLNPLGAAAVGLGFGALMAGGEGLARTSPIGSSLVTLIQAIAVLGYLGFLAWKAARPEPVLPDEPHQEASPA